MYIDDGAKYTRIAIGRNVFRVARKGFLYSVGIVHLALYTATITAIGILIKHSMYWICNQNGLLLDSSRKDWIKLYAKKYFLGRYYE